ncbi:TPA: oligosaccharide flippase family protein [Clostridium perfringens]|nr:oligosaccharide flippase family protein [Clostridium perfringens]
MSKITKNYLYNLLYQVFVLFVPIITAPYLARVLGPTSQGVASYIISMANILSTITLLGIYNYGNRQIAYERDNRDKMSQTFWEIMSIRFLLAIIGSIIYFFMAIRLKEFSVYFFIYYLWMIAIYFDCTWVYVGVEDMKPAVIKNFITKLLTVLGIFILIKTSSDIYIYILLLGSSALIANMLAYTQLKIYINKPKLNVKNLSMHLKGSIKMFLPTVATLIYLQVDKVMIEFFTGQTNQVSFYDNAEKIVTIPLTFITVLSTVMMPRIANEFIKGNNEKVRGYIQKAGIISLFLAFPMTFGVIAISTKFVPWYLGNEYIPVIWGIIIIAPIIIGNSMEGISGRQYFIATNQIPVLTKSYGITAIINIIINIGLIPKYGFIGAAIATGISSYICVLIQFYYLSKQISIKCFILYGFKYLIYSILMFIAIKIITYKMNSNFITTIIQILIGGIVYFTIAYVTKDKIFKELLNKVLKYSNKIKL